MNISIGEINDSDTTRFYRFVNYFSCLRIRLPHDDFMGLNGKKKEDLNMFRGVRSNEKTPSLLRSLFREEDQIRVRSHILQGLVHKGFARRGLDFCRKWQSCLHCWNGTRRGITRQREKLVVVF